LVTEKELERTKILAATFASPGGVGEKLQEYLEERAASMENWVNQIKRS
jgi:hypothetical protein